MPKAEFEKISRQLDDGELDEEDLFDNFGFDMSDPGGWDDPELDDFYPIEKETA